MEPGSRWARSCCESQQSEQERSLTPLLTRVGPARRYAVVLRAGAGVIRPGSTYRGGAQQHGPREAAPRHERHRTRSWRTHRVLYDVYGGDWISPYD